MIPRVILWETAVQKIATVFWDFLYFYLYFKERERERRRDRKIMSYTGFNVTKGDAECASLGRAGKGVGVKIEGWRSLKRWARGLAAQGESAEKNTPANKSQTLPHTPRTACGTGQFFNGSGRAWILVNFYFLSPSATGIRHCPRGFVRSPYNDNRENAAERAGVYLPTYLPT